MRDEDHAEMEALTPFVPQFDEHLVRTHSGAKPCNCCSAGKKSAASRNRKRTDRVPSSPEWNPSCATGLESQKTGVPQFQQLSGSVPLSNYGFLQAEQRAAERWLTREKGVKTDE